MQERDYYGDPERYDSEYGFVSADLPWYLDRVTRCGEPALVLGCGTGRVLFHLARAGLRVDGIDCSPEMLAWARTRAVMLGADVAARVELIEADIRDFSLVRRYRAVLAPLNLLMHLHTDGEVLACLECVKNHLQAGGHFFFDVSNPHKELLQDHGGPRGLPLRDIVVRGVKTLQRERHRYDPETGISELTFFFEPSRPDIEPYRTTLRLRMFSAEDLQRLLGQAGFEILEHQGSFGGQAFDGSGPVQILVTRPNGMSKDHAVL